MFHGTITQDLLDDPNSMLRNQIAGQKILSTTTLIVRTNPAAHAVACAGGFDDRRFALLAPTTPRVMIRAHGGRHRQISAFSRCARALIFGYSLFGMYPFSMPKRSRLSDSVRLGGIELRLLFF
jgi:hypothetical protein